MKPLKIKILSGRKSEAEMWSEHLKSIKPQTEKEIQKGKRTEKMIKDYFANKL